ncbi:pilus assembly PilX N-terminal domain-containing protein [bacterium]|nr:pilus assembly PilX N-terminal domain-containing protein [bacterium]
MTQKGVSLYLAVVILAVLMTGVLSLVALTVAEIKITSTVGYSTVAFYAADTGCEHSLYDILKKGGSGEVNGTLDEILKSYPSYSVSISTSEGKTTISSVGVFKNTSRKIEVSY